MTEPFDDFVEAYDRWYDEPEGRAILEAELACLRRVAGGFDGRWLEVGVGTGRFASNLGIGEGVDSSGEMLRPALARGVVATLAKAESLPHGNGVFDGVLMALALCFIQDAKQALLESFRVLRPKGTLLIGVVPAESPWGELYAKKKAAGHPVYRHARFRTIAETIQLVEEAGFVLQQTACTLFWPPEGKPEPEILVENGSNGKAGFVALRFMKNGDNKMTKHASHGREDIERYEESGEGRHHHRGKSSESIMNKRAILAALAVHPGQTVLDAGCGNGYMAKEFSRLVEPTGKVYALDPDDIAIATLREETGETNIEAVVGDITSQTTLPAAAFDLIYLSTVVHGFAFDQRHGFAAEVKRLLAPEGRLAIVEIMKRATPFGPPMEMRLSPEELTAVVGLKPMTLIEINEYFYMQIFENKLTSI